MTVGNQSIYATVKGTIPIVGVVTANAADPTAKNVFFLNGSQTSVLGPFGTYTKQRLPKVKTVAIVYPTDPGAITAAQALQKAMRQIELKVTMIGVPPLATDLIGPATQASSSDMIVAALGFTTCVPFARAIDQINYTKPMLSTPICTFLPRAAYAGGDIPQWTYGIAQTLVNQPGPQSKLYLKKGLQYGTHRQRHALGLLGGRLGGAARDREDHEPDPVLEAQLPRRSPPGSRPSAARPSSGRRTSPAARSRPESRPRAATRRSSTTTSARASGRPPRAG